MKFCFYVLLLAASGSVCAFDLISNAGVRSFPQSSTVELQIREEIYLWQMRDQEFWKFGLLQARAQVAAHGEFQAGISIFPVGFLEFFVTESSTSRFYKSPVFDCDRNLCQSILRRTYWGFRSVLAWQNWIIQPSYTMTRLSSEDKSLPLVDEQENLLVNAGGEDLQSYSVFAAYRKDSWIYGLYLQQSQLMQSGSQNQTQFLVARRNQESFSYSVGGGRYFSSFTDPQISVFASLGWHWGESKALF